VEVARVVAVGGGERVEGVDVRARAVARECAEVPVAVGPALVGVDRHVAVAREQRLVGVEGEAPPAVRGRDELDAVVAQRDESPRGVGVARERARLGRDGEEGGGDGEGPGLCRRCRIGVLPTTGEFSPATRGIDP
jgi:hypothetical protein